ncbi:MAG TPA: PilZ domain-containing protein [Rhizomicrobium sp.]|nr:PilZ domain-containing protein [Rhizomicrobium sp.]
MAVPAQAMSEDREALVARSRADRRRYRRVNVDLPGRFFFPADGREGECRVVDLSPGGAQIDSGFLPEPEAQIILYVEGFGRLEGQVTRPEGANFGVMFNCSALKRERIAEQLMLLMNRGLLDDAVIRRHERAPAPGMATFTRSNGDVVACEVVDLSLSGVSLNTRLRPPVGETVLIGQMAGRVARHHEHGIAIEFMRAASEPTPAEQRLRLAVSN